MRHCVDKIQAVPVPKTVPEEPQLDQMADRPIGCLLHLALPPGAERRATEFGGWRISLQRECTTSHINTALLNCHRMFYSYKNVSFKIIENSNVMSPAVPQVSVCFTRMIRGNGSVVLNFCSFVCFFLSFFFVT